MRKRTVVLFIVILLMFSGLIVQVYDLTGGALFQAAEQQATLTVTVANSRGTIYDSKQRPLNNQQTEYRACVAGFPEATAALRSVLDEEQLEKLEKQLQTGKPAVVTINDLISPVEGISLFSVPVRNSGYTTAPHVVGYLDGDGLHGATGAELAFDDYLNETGGKATVTYTVDALGRPLQGVEPTISNTLGSSKAGVVLTIDQDIQLIAEKAAKKYMTRGAVVVMEPGTGRIVAMVSMPDFQPDTVAECLEDPDSPLLNRALCNYNCGSVFKIVSTATALEAGYSLAYSYTCTGSISVGDVTFHCHNRLGHGALSLTGAFAQSCNPFFVNLMRHVGGDKLYRMSTIMGFDRPILLCEGIKTARAVLPTEAELQSPAAVGNLSFGQGSLLATPVHIAQMVAAVVNDGEIVRPTLLKGYVDQDGTLKESAPAPGQSAFSAETAATLRDLMINAVVNGTGAGGKPFRYGAGGKTGTAETGWESDGKAVVQSWYAGFFSDEDPKYVIAVLAEDANNTGGKSAPVFKQICEELALHEKYAEGKIENEN